MVVRFGVASLLASLALLGAACEEPDDSGKRPVFPISTAGIGAVAPPCQVGDPCRCESGLTGHTKCTGKVPSCDCSICEGSSTVPTTEAPYFEACAGDVLGSWHLTAMDYAAVEYGPSTATQKCPADVVESSPPRMLLRLLEGGGGDAFLGGLSSSSIVLEKCLNERSGREATCTGYAGCSFNTCGLCACGGEKTPYGFFPIGAGWEVAGATLKLTDSGLELASYDYCVSGNKLTLRPQGQDYLLELERVEFAGTPLPCAERIEEASCIDVSTNPARRRESFEACGWDGSQCTGTPATRCLFGDYDVLPGCVATPSAAP